MAPPTINANTPARVGPTTNATQTTAAFNAPANAIILVGVTVDSSGTTSPTITLSNNGTALTWTDLPRRDGSETNGRPGTVAFYRTVIPAGGRTGLTISVTQSIAGRNTTFQVYVIDGGNPNSVIGAVLEGSRPVGTNTLNTDALVTAFANSLCFFIGNESELGPGLPTSNNATINAYSGSGFSGATGYIPSGAAGSSIIFNLDAAGTSTAISWNFVAVEVREAPGTTYAGAVSLTAPTSLTVNGSPPFAVRQGAVSLTAVTSLTTNPSVIKFYAGQVSLTPTPTLTARSGSAGNVSLTAVTSLSIAGRITLFVAQVSLTAVTSITAGFPRQTMRAVVGLTAIASLALEGRRSRSTAIATRYARPAYEHPFRIIVQEVLSGEIVDWDLPVQEDFTYTRQLSGPTIMSGNFKPELISVQELGLDGYAYWFHVEINEEIRASAIFMPPTYEDQGMSFTCEGFSAVPHYTTWQSSLSVIGVDVFSIVRSIWNHVQSDPRSAYGISVSNNFSSIALGTDATSQLQKERTEAAQAIAARFESGDPIFEDWTWTGAPAIVTAHNDHLQALFDRTTNVTAVNWLNDYADSNPVKEAEPYELQWWEAPNCGEQIDTLAQQTPFDYRERVNWNIAKNDPLMFLDLGYPRLGSTRDNLVFDEDNILEIVPIQEDEESYASEVIVIGAGEGAATIRGYASSPFSKRVKKSYVLTDKTITTTQRANAVAVEELNARRGKLFEIDEIVVRPYHANAPIGSYDVGDDIYIEVEIPWLNVPYGAWYRITAITSQPSTDIIRISVARSDSFRYSGSRSA